MELNYDWKGFQSLFFPKKRFSANETLPAGPIYWVVEGQVIVCAFADSEDLSEWVGATRDEIIAQFAHRELVFYDRAKVDQWLDSAIGLPHFYDQIHYLKSETKPTLLGRSRFKGQEVGNPRHFLLQMLQSWWQKIFPSTYGVYIELNDGSTPPVHSDSAMRLLLVIQRGRVNSFHIPDLSSMIRERRKYPADVVKHLSSKYLVPVQGVFISAAEWTEWSESPNPWAKILKSVKADHGKMVPYKWSLTSLLALRVYLGI